MYVPKHYHWIGPVATVALGFGIRQQFGASWDVALFVQLPLDVIAVEWGAYIWQAGKMYQGYLTQADTDVNRLQKDLDREAAERAQARDAKPLPAINTYKPTLAPGMIENQFVSTAPEIDMTDHDIKMICRRQLTYRKHPELGHPRGDYREETWRKQMSRERLVAARSVLEFAGGIVKSAPRRNAPYVTIDWNVIDLGAHGQPLPHPSS